MLNIIKIRTNLVHQVLRNKTSKKQIIDLIITKKNWLILFIKFLFNLLRIIGYEVDYKNNSHNSFFDLESIEFKEHQNDNTLVFPHKLLNNEEKVKFNSVNSANHFYKSKEKELSAVIDSYIKDKITII